jgi:hypothetical protein
MILDREAVVAESRGIPVFGLLHADLAAAANLVERRDAPPTLAGLAERVFAPVCRAHPLAASGAEHVVGRHEP